MNENQAFVVAISLAVIALRIVGTFVLVWKLLGVFRGIKFELSGIDNSLGEIRDEGQNIVGEIERLANEFVAWNEAVENELKEA
jgi:hypothetical protein